MILLAYKLYVVCLYVDKLLNCLWAQGIAKLWVNETKCWKVSLRRCASCHQTKDLLRQFLQIWPHVPTRQPKLQHAELSFLDHAINGRILLFHLPGCNLAVSVIWAKSILGLSSGFFGSWGWLIEDELLHFNTMFFWSHIRAQQVLRVKQVQNCMRISLHECVKINWKGYEYTKCSLCDVPKSSDAPHYPLLAISKPQIPNPNCNYWKTQKNPFWAFWPRGGFTRKTQ